ncbi:MAG: hypothetical protein PVF73_09815, partial [Bacteroidales bacterium]
MKKTITLLLFLCMITWVIHAQKNVPVTGIQEDQNTPDPIALNLEEKVTEGIENPSAPFTDETMEPSIVISTVHKTDDMNLVLSASSNTLEERVILNIDEFDGLNYKLTDMDGRIL